MQFLKNRYGRDSVEPAIKPGETALVCTLSFVHEPHTNETNISLGTYGIITVFRQGQWAA